ncbi:hypothetical protein ZIOFF_007276 [Zingiber officinale]|uniref:Uncharacterized protein n=1 Tax=Zingiber officinale TaxID=94328 RepID=A0A8J5HTC5_ZINOF|nr:hypothetical protein ZIOFF_007276 [Zingiber officinale]
MIKVLCSITSRLSFGTLGVITALYFFRFWHDFSIDGGYPLFATIMSEYAYKKTCDTFIAVVFTMQGLAILTGGMVTIIVSAAFKNRF